MTDEKIFKKTMVAKPVHHWLLISACLMTFVILPLLFVWSSLNIIHNRTGDELLLSQAVQFELDGNDFKKIAHHNEG